MFRSRCHAPQCTNPLVSIRHHCPPANRGPKSAPALIKNSLVGLHKQVGSCLYMSPKTTRLAITNAEVTSGVGPSTNVLCGFSLVSLVSLVLAFDGFAFELAFTSLLSDDDCAAALSIPSVVPLADSLAWLLARLVFLSGLLLLFHQVFQSNLMS